MVLPVAVALDVYCRTKSANQPKKSSGPVLLLFFQRNFLQVTSRSSVWPIRTDEHAKETIVDCGCPVHDTGRTLDTHTQTPRTQRKPFCGGNTSDSDSDGTRDHDRRDVPDGWMDGWMRR